MVVFTEVALTSGRTNRICSTRYIAGVAKRHWNVQSSGGSGQARRDLLTINGLKTLKDEVEGSAIATSRTSLQMNQ